MKLSSYRKPIDIIVMSLSFLFIFAVSFKGVPNFSYIGIILLPILCIFVPNSKVILSYIYTTISKRVVFFTILSFLFVVVLVSVYATFRQTYDIEFAVPVLHIIASIPACLFISAYIFQKASIKPQDNLLKPLYSYLSFIFFLQVFFILLMLFVPEVADYINSLTKSDALLERMATYGGSRGLGLSGSVAFGLAVLMAQLMYIVFFLKFSIQNYKIKNIDFILILASSVAVLSAGRTSIAGIAILIMSLLIISLTRSGLGNIFKTIVVLPIFLIIISLVLLSINIPSVQTYIFYVFQPIQHYIDYGNFQVSSLEGLENMYFIPSEQTLLIGDARYTGVNGVAYYMGTDAGYMRYLLFFGLPVSILIYILWTVIAFSFYFQIKKVLPYSFILITSVLIMSFIFQYKGQFVLVAVSFYKIFFIFVFYLLLLKNYKVKHN